jgi:predicted dehydrogenase/threonine dehydrogenase-like Zn-dependent dehydrogenase
LKQIIQNLKTGETILENLPAPMAKEGQVLIQTSRSLVSLGTERMLVEFGKANLIQKARQQPDKVKMVLDKIKSDGLMPTLETVFKKLDQPLPLGYCNVGRIIEIGDNVTGFKIGDRVASNGQHAEIVSIPQNLVAHIPDEVSDEEACFTVIGSIGLQGIRLLNPAFGETIVVVGLGLIGLITAQLLVANGCNVIGLDIDEEKLKLAREKGVNAFNPTSGDPVKYCQDQNGGSGVDGVIITASSKSNDIISQAAKMSRKRGRIILVGVIGLELNRSEFYEKELSFQVSCSYGPGRYDANYEQKGQDYPLPFVRWTENRNFQTILSSIKTGKIDVQPLITEIVDLENYKEIYGNMGNKKSIASILKYSDSIDRTKSIHLSKRQFEKNNSIIGIIGAGNFTKMTLLPLLKTASIKYLASAGGLNATTLAKKYKIPYSSTDYKEVLNDPEVELVMITTRHNLHAQMVIDSLNAGKHVFVEKPLALNNYELNQIKEVYNQSNLTVTVGFNRRFSPHIQKIKSLVNPDAPKNIIATMNAGFIPQDVWVHDMEIGGGRIVGEACHFMDLITFLSGSKIKSVCMSSLGKTAEVNTDNASILLKYENGDQGTIHYFSNGNKAYSKERVELYCQEKTIIMDNFRTTKGFGYSNFNTLKTKLDKGHQSQFDALQKRIKEGGDALILFDEIENTSKASFAAIQSLQEKSWIDIS